MKKVYMILLALCGIGLVIKGVSNFLPMDFSYLSENSAAYNMGHNVGVIFRKITKIIIGVFLIKFCFEWFYDDNYSQKTN